MHIDVNINLKPTDGTNPGKQQCSSKGKAMTFSTSYPKPRHQNLPYTITSEQLVESISINKVNKSLLLQINDGRMPQETRSFDTLEYI